jgi:TPR repeat protein
LAAAQGLPQAEWRMGVICRTGRGGVRKSFFTAAHWMRKAALQGDPDAQEDLGWTLLHAKMEIFDGKANFVGHSAIPEATFWFETAEASMKAHGREFEKIEFRPFSHCEHCVKPCDRIMKCSRCRGAGYCSKECQKVHWKLGHKIDCTAIDKYRKILQERATRKTFVGQPEFSPNEGATNGVQTYYEYY